MNRPLFPMDVLMILMESRNRTTDATDQFCIMYICRKPSAVESSILCLTLKCSADTYLLLGLFGRLT